MKVSIWDRRSWGALREARGITYVEIAEACGVFPKTPQKWFSGYRNPGLEHQLIMARLLGIPLNDALAAVKDSNIRVAIRSAYND
ncbi:helix-turn-helix domain-containing protein [Streptomyces hawaiiensis]|uniref:helix-turn-helix domain-containing protein n=1 Tax=Streptomyces hawaiiensis TaxID=67305 RepID=UPI00364EB8FC